MEKEVKKVYHGLISEAEYAALENKDPSIQTLIVPIPGKVNEYAVGYVVKPDRDIMGRTARLYDINPVKANEMVLNHIWRAGDDRIKTVDELFYSASEQIKDLIKYYKATLKKKLTSGA